VSELCHIPRETPGQHRDLRRQTDAHRCRRKSLIASALMGFGVRQHVRRESISKRARSTTPTSLRFRINELRSVWNSVAQNAPSKRSVPGCGLYSAVCGGTGSIRLGNCVRPLDVLRPLTWILLRRYGCAFLSRHIQIVDLKRSAFSRPTTSWPSIARRALAAARPPLIPRRRRRTAP
jgi:hypothetical protein